MLSLRNICVTLVQLFGLKINFLFNIAQFELKYTNFAVSQHVRLLSPCFKVFWPLDIQLSPFIDICSNEIHLS